jgi:hypothetical protein
MIFENPNVLPLLIVLPLALAVLGWRAWRIRKEVAAAFALELAPQRDRQVEKYVVACLLVGLIVLAIALPKVQAVAIAGPAKTGEVALLVDNSGSMAAQKDLNGPHRLARAKTYLYEIVDALSQVGQVKISLHGYTNIARSHVPLVGKEDYGYLKESIRQVLDINSTPGQGSSLGPPILTAAAKFSKGEQAKVIVLIGDGEPFVGATRGLRDQERAEIEQAVQKAKEDGIKIIAVGVGEREGAKIPIRNAKGEFTGEYYKLQGLDYVSNLEESLLIDIAARTGGKYFYEGDRRGLVEFLVEQLRSTGETATQEFKVYQSVAHWFLLAALAVWVLFARRHVLG